MSFQSKVRAFSSRFVSARSFELIVAPALADLEYEADAGQLRNRIAVCRALAGALRIDVANQAGTFLVLALVPACYYFVLMTVCFDFFSGRNALSGFVALTAPLLLLSIAPATVCFWPERRTLESSK